jgi:hypothetical protein
MSLDGGSSDSNTQQQGTSNSVTSQNQSQTSQGTGTVAPVNQQDILRALGYAGAGFDALNPQTMPGMAQAGLAGINGAAGNANSLYGVGNNQLAQTMSGQYLMPGSNPFLDANYRHAADMLEGQSRSAWGGQDVMPGSGMQQAALANAQGNLANQMYGQNFAQERQNQLGATSQLPSYVAGSFQPAQQQLTAGYLPLDKYISQLSTLSPGTQTTKNVTSNMSGTGVTNGTSSSTGEASGSSLNWGMSLK